VIPGTTQQWQKPVAPLPPNFKTTRRERLVIKESYNVSAVYLIFDTNVVLK
jgi:hypothetical protein